MYLDALLVCATERPGTPVYRHTHYPVSDAPGLRNATRHMPHITFFSGGKGVCIVFWTLTKFKILIFVGARVDIKVETHSSY